MGGSAASQTCCIVSCHAIAVLTSNIKMDELSFLHFALKRLAQVVTQAFYLVLTTLHIEV